MQQRKPTPYQPQELTRLSNLLRGDCAISPSSKSFSNCQLSSPITRHIRLSRFTKEHGLFVVYRTAIALWPDNRESQTAQTTAPSCAETLYCIFTRMDRAKSINNEDPKIYIFIDVNIRPESNDNFENHPITQQATPQAKPG